MADNKKILIDESDRICINVREKTSGIENGFYRCVISEPKEIDALEKEMGDFFKNFSEKDKDIYINFEDKVKDFSYRNYIFLIYKVCESFGLTSNNLTEEQRAIKESFKNYFFTIKDPGFPEVKEEKLPNVAEKELLTISKYLIDKKFDANVFNLSSVLFDKNSSERVLKLFNEVSERYKDKYKTDYPKEITNKANGVKNFNLSVGCNKIDKGLNEAYGSDKVRYGSEDRQGVETIDRKKANVNFLRENIAITLSKLLSGNSPDQSVVSYKLNYGKEKNVEKTAIYLSSDLVPDFIDPKSALADEKSGKKMRSLNEKDRTDGKTFFNGKFNDKPINNLVESLIVQSILNDRDGIGMNCQNIGLTPSIKDDVEGYDITLIDFGKAFYDEDDLGSDLIPHKSKKLVAKGIHTVTKVVGRDAFADFDNYDIYKEVSLYEQLKQLNKILKKIENGNVLKKLKEEYKGTFCEKNENGFLKEDRREFEKVINTSFDFVEKKINSMKKVFGNRLKIINSNPEKAELLLNSCETIQKLTFTSKINFNVKGEIVTKSAKSYIDILLTEQFIDDKKEEVIEFVLNSSVHSKQKLKNFKELKEKLATKFDGKVILDSKKNIIKIKKADFEKVNIVLNAALEGKKEQLIKEDKSLKIRKNLKNIIEDSEATIRKAQQNSLIPTSEFDIEKALKEQNERVEKCKELVAEAEKLLMRRYVDEYEKVKKYKKGKEEYKFELFLFDEEIAKVQKAKSILNMIQRKKDSKEKIKVKDFSKDVEVTDIDEDFRINVSKDKGCGLICDLNIIKDKDNNEKYLEFKIGDPATRDNFGNKFDSFISHTLKVKIPDNFDLVSFINSSRREGIVKTLINNGCSEQDMKIFDKEENEFKENSKTFEIFKKLSNETKTLERVITKKGNPKEIIFTTPDSR